MHKDHLFGFLVCPKPNFNLFAVPRAAFVAPPEAPKSLGWLDDKAEKDRNFWQSLNAEVPFSMGINKIFEDLSKKVFPDAEKPENRRLQIDYQDALVQQLASELQKKNLTLHEFWDNLQKENCTSLRIEKGHFAAYSNEKPIDLGKYMGPIDFKAVSGITLELHTEKEQSILEAKNSLTQFRLSLAAENSKIAAFNAQYEKQKLA